MSERTELLELIADTKAYLLFLKETGVEEVFAKSKEEARNKKQEIRNTIDREASMSLSSQRGMNNNPLNPTLVVKENQRDKNVPPILNLPPVQRGSHNLTMDRRNSQNSGMDRRGFLTPPEGFSGKNKAELLSTLLEKIGDCKRCKLSTGRTNIVFGTGNPDTRLMFVGEGPGEEEDRQGKPFVGKAGELLTKMITAMGLTRDDVYIANVLKCRPPGNRNPEGDEITACSPFLKEQLDIIKPEIICTLGTFASQTLLETKTSISKLRGQIHIKDGSRIIPTFHPAYLLRNPGDKKLSWEDLQIIMKELGMNSHEPRVHKGP